MPQKIKMFLSNGNNIYQQNNKYINTSSLAIIQSPQNVENLLQKNKNFSLNSSIIGRIHNVKPGCGSCGRH
jgi:hypothetical protein